MGSYSTDIERPCIALSPDETYLLVIGGWRGIHSTATTYYHISLNSWSTGPLMNIGRADHTCQVVNNHVYVIAGYNNAAKYMTTDYTLSEVEKLSLASSSNSWDTLSDKLDHPRHYASSVTVNGIIYVIGGRQDTIDWFFIDVIDTANGDNIYTSSAYIPEPGDYGVALFTGGYVYVMGGSRGYFIQKSNLLLPTQEPTTELPTTISSTGDPSVDQSNYPSNNPTNNPTEFQTRVPTDGQSTNPTNDPTTTTNITSSTDAVTGKSKDESGSNSTTIISIILGLVVLVLIMCALFGIGANKYRKLQNQMVQMLDHQVNDSSIDMQLDQELMQ